MAFRSPVARHHCLVLCLRYLVLAQVKATSQGRHYAHFDRLDACLRRRATHCKSAWRTPDHIHRHGGIQIHGAVAHHRNRAGGGSGVACSVLYGVGE